MQAENKIITYHYKFILANGVQREFEVKLDNKTLNLIPCERKSYPQWTKLKYFKCPNCSLDEKQHKFCPIAINLVGLIDFFKNSISYEEADVIVESQGRKYMKHTTLQKGISSLLGIYMVTSGCPITEKLKPMVRHHLPFTTLEETEYRVLSMYLLAQYFLYKRGKKPDWELKGLTNLYENIRTVNKNFCKRFSDIKKDASINALIILNNFADMMTFLIDENMLNEIELLFNAYFE